MILIVAIIVGIIFLILTFLYFFPIIYVSGDSMYPTYKDGDIILGKSHFNPNDIKKGDIIVFHLPFLKKLLIKRVASIHNEEYVDKKSFFVLGDNSGNSNDSRDFGWVDEEDLVAIILNPREKRSI